MLVYALATSVAINSALCVLFFTLHSKLRKNPIHFDVYIPRLLAQGSSRRKKRVLLDTITPSGWFSKAWKLTEDELLASSGLDAVVFMRLINLSLKIFSFAGIIGIFVLLPVNCLGNQLADFDLADWKNYSLDVFTISNVNNGSDRLWIHFAAVYAMTVFVCILLYTEYRYISKRRLAFFYSSKPQPHDFTILVRGIPTPAGTSISDSVESFFKEYHPSTYLSHTVIWRSRKIQALANEGKKLYRRIAQMRSSSRTQEKSKRGYCFGLFGSKTDLVNDYEKKLMNIEENVRLEHSSAGKEVRAAFVSFKSRYGAAMALHMQQSENPTHWITEKAPAPHDVHWPFFAASFMQRWILKLIVWFTYIIFTIMFLIPVVLAQGLTNLSQLEVWFPFLRFILDLSFVSQIITGYLPNLILQLFLKPIPPVMEFLASTQGYISHTDIEKSASNKFLWFLIWNVFLATVLSGSALYQVSIILEFRDIPSKLADGVPSQASFFIAYVVTSGWTIMVSEELFRVMPFASSLIRKYLTGIREREFEVPSLLYHRDMPRILFFGLLGITYFFLAPLILPFLLIYLCMACMIYKNQFMNVYEPKYESGGKFWPVVHDSMILSLIIMHLIALGIFTTKKLPEASSFIFPLPILTLIFNYYCRKRFLPIFHAYSAETLIKKDKEDQKDPSMAEFYNELITAYQDPALLPTGYSNSDNLSRPFLSSEIQG